MNTDIDPAHSTDDEAMYTSEVQPSVRTSNVCVVCQDIVFGEFKCLSCNKNVHVKCGKTNFILTEEFEVSQESNIICLLCYSENNIESERLSAKTSMEKQATRMLDRSNKVLDEVEIGCNVVVPIPNVDRGKGDTKNIMAVVQIKTEKGYRLATKQGILLGSYTRNQFEPTDGLFLKPSDNLADNFISVRQAVRLNSICDDQGFQKCDCSGKNR